MDDQRAEDQLQPLPTEKLQPVVVEVKHPTAGYVYSNIMGLGMSQVDVRITFAEAFPDGNVETKVGIVMTPEQAASLALILLQHINLYERQFGNVRNAAWQQAKENALPLVSKFPDVKEGQ